MTIHHFESQMMMMKTNYQLDKLRSSKSMHRHLLPKIKGNFKISIQQGKCWVEVDLAKSLAVYIKKLEKREK